MTDAQEDRSNSETTGESYGGLLEGIGPAASELSFTALVSTVTFRALRAAAGFLSYVHSERLNDARQRAGQGHGQQSVQGGGSGIRIGS